MNSDVKTHYSGDGALSDAIAKSLSNAGFNLAKLKTTDLTSIDEFHIRGRKATLELAEQMHIGENALVLDVGSGLGGPARTIAEVYGCQVKGIDLTDEFCNAANTLSRWVGLSDKVAFLQGDATAIAFDDNMFDAAMTIHVAMNIPDKLKVYTEVRRVLKPSGIFAAYDVVQGEGGEVLYPVPWAREPSISHLATPHEMESLLNDAGFEILRINDSTEESQSWFEAIAVKIAESGPSVRTTQILFGDVYPQMAQNQVRNLAERRIRTVSYICSNKPTFTDNF